MRPCGKPTVAEFPLLFTVGHRIYSAGAEDDWGNTVSGWSDPVDKPVYGWGAPVTSEPKLAGHDRDVVEIELLVPPGFECSPRDRMVLDGDEYEVIGGTEMYDHNPFGWNPGGVVNLRAVSG
nr:MAG TPA: Minor capsid protein [Caudoviricetes sp.]